MTPINNNQMSEELDKIIQEYAETLEEKIKLEPMTSDWIHRVIFFNTENLKVDLSTLISHERAEVMEKCERHEMETLDAVCKCFNITSLHTERRNGVVTKVKGTIDGKKKEYLSKEVCG